MILTINGNFAEAARMRVMNDYGTECLGDAALPAPLGPKS